MKSASPMAPNDQRRKRREATARRVAQALRRLMDRDGLTQTEVSARTGIARSSLSDYLRGMRAPSVDALGALARSFGVTPGSLLGGSRR